MIFKIVQKVAAIDIASAGGISTSAPIAMKTGYIRITPELDTYIEVGPNPGINTSTSVWVPGKETIIIKEEWGSKGFVGVETGTNTTIIFPQGTGGGFNVGEYVSVSGVSPVGVNTNYAVVVTVDNSMSYDSYHNTRLTLDWDTSSISSVTNSEGELRKVTKVSAYNAGSGANKIHITEVQVNSYA
jgi:hypothetical protein